MSVCAVLSTMRTRQILFLSCTPWPLTLVENFDKKSSTWGSWPHVEHRRPGGRRGVWRVLGGMLSVVVLRCSPPQLAPESPRPPLTYQRTARHPETISNTGCPRVSTANDDTAPSQGLHHPAPPPCSATIFCSHVETVPWVLAEDRCNSEYGPDRNCLREVATCSPHYDA